MPEDLVGSLPSWGLFALAVVWIALREAREYRSRGSRSVRPPRPEEVRAAMRDVADADAMRERTETTQRLVAQQAELVDELRVNESRQSEVLDELVAASRRQESLLVRIADGTDRMNDALVDVAGAVRESAEPPSRRGR